MPELKPCPFCGGTHIMVGESDKLHNESIIFPEPICFVECMNCRATAGFYKKNFQHGGTEYDARKEAVKAWNRRATE